MLGMLFAERAIFGNCQPVGVVALVFVTVVVTVLALGAFKRYLCSDISFFSHLGKTPYKKITPPFWVLTEFSTPNGGLSTYFLSVLNTFNLILSAKSRFAASAPNSVEVAFGIA